MHGKHVLMLSYFFFNINSNSFPKSIERKKEWCNAILILTGQIIPLKTNRTYLICTKHFSPEDTVFDEYGTTVLTKDAVPKYFPDSDKQSQGYENTLSIVAFIQYFHSVFLFLLWLYIV